MDATHAVFLQFLAFLKVAFAFLLNGTITMENSTDMSQISAGSSISFTFSTKLNIAAATERLLMSISGDSLEFSNQTRFDSVNWMLTDSAGKHRYTRHSTDLDLREVMYDPINRVDNHIAYLLNISVSLDIGEWSINGSFEMLVADDITDGSLVRGMMTVAVRWTTSETSTETIASNYHILPLPSVKAEAVSPLTQPIMGLFTAHVVIHTSRDLLDCSIQGHTLPDVVSTEVRLTVQKLSVSTNETYGTTPETMRKLMGVSGSKLSTLGSYQNNVGIMMLPSIPRDTTNFSDLNVVSEFTVRVEDYNNLKSGDTWPVVLGASFRGTTLWMEELEVTISAPSVSLPELTVDIQQTKECAYDGSATADLQVFVNHASTSTGTAYNVTVNVYLPDYMTMKKYVFTTPLQNTIVVRQNGTVIVTEIARLTFSDPFILTVTLDVDLSSQQIMEASSRIVTVEAVCDDRWDNVTDILTDTAYVSVEVNHICARRLTWTTSSTCICDHDITRSDCGCCVTGACQCGQARPHACAPCGENWRCVSYKEGFEDMTTISKSDLTKSIRCDSFCMRRGSATGVSCYKILSTSPYLYLELSPRVAVVTGINSASGFLYGIANNGLAYVISQDGGSTWTSIMDDVYESAALDPMFISANKTVPG